MLQYMICKRFVRSLYSFHCFYYILQNQQLQNFYSSYAIGISMSSKFITRIYIPTWNPFLALLSSQWSKQFCCSCVFEITCKKNILSLNICSWQTNNKSEELETNYYLERSNAENLIWNLDLSGNSMNITNKKAIQLRYASIYIIRYLIFKSLFFAQNVSCNEISPSLQCIKLSWLGLILSKVRAHELLLVFSQDHELTFYEGWATPSDLFLWTNV